MADKDKRLTKEQRDTFINWINSKAKNHDCPVCGENDWRVGSQVIHSMTENYFSTGTVYPQVFLSCNNCAFVRYFMAIQAGVVEKEDNESKSEEDSDG